MSTDNKYTLLNFIDDVIESCCFLAITMAVITISAMAWGVWNPQIKEILRTVQSVIFG
jgi:hypothetical protein